MSPLMWGILQGGTYLAVIVFLLLVLLPRLIDAMTWDGDFPEHGRWFSDEYYGGSDRE